MKKLNDSLSILLGSEELEKMKAGLGPSVLPSTLLMHTQARAPLRNPREADLGTGSPLAVVSLLFPL